MRAAIVERPGVLRVRDVPRPVPGEYEVLCELLYGATCTGTDRHIIHNRLPWTTPYPCILGHESIGRVVEVGPKVRSFKPGDVLTRVNVPAASDGSYGISWGGFAEYGIARDHFAMREDDLPEQRWDSHRVNQLVPSDIDPRAATMIITWRETLSYVSRMGFGRGARVLVIGSGGNGLAVVAHARNLGASRVAMVGSPARESIARAAGATEYYDYSSEQLDAAPVNGGTGGFDFIIDAVGREGMLSRLLPVLANRGTIGVYGLDESVTVDPRRAKGTFTYYGENYDEEEAHDRVIAYIRDGLLDARLWLDLDRAYALDDIGEAFEALERKEVVKALIRLAPG